jgi:hypothetical protein
MLVSIWCSQNLKVESHRPGFKDFWQKKPCCLVRCGFSGHSVSCLPAASHVKIESPQFVFNHLLIFHYGTKFWKKGLPHTPPPPKKKFLENSWYIKTVYQKFLADKHMVSLVTKYKAFRKNRFCGFFLYIVFFEDGSFSINCKETIICLRK